MLANITSKLIIPAFKNPSNFLASQNKSQLFGFKSQLLLEQPKPLLAFKSIFLFSSSLSPSSQVPLIYKLRKHANFAKLNSGPTSPEHLETLHELAITLTSFQYFDEAVSVAESMIKHYQQVYDRSGLKTFVQENKRFLFYQFLNNLYKVSQNYDKYFSSAHSLIRQYESRLMKQPELSSLILELYFDVGNDYFQLGNFDQSLRMLQIAVSKRLNSLNKNEMPVSPKLIKAKNMIGNILLHNKNQSGDAFKVLSDNFVQIQKIPKDKIEHQTVSNCILGLTQSYINKMPNLTIQQTADYLKSITGFIKSVEIEHQKKYVKTQSLLHFYQNLAQLCLHTKDYNKAIQFYRIQKQKIHQNDFVSQALCYENQAKVHEATKKIEKAIEKLNKSMEKRQKIHEIYFPKRRKTPEQQTILKENKQKMLQTSAKLIELHKGMKNNKKVAECSVRYETLLK